jgi:hypothetical protein
MPLFNDILAQPINLIHSYIKQNKFYTLEQTSMSLTARCTANMYWLFGRNNELTAKKVKLAEEFVVLLEETTATFNSSNPSTLDTVLKAIQEKITLETQTVLAERIAQKTEPGSYDASLIVFAKLISFMLGRVKPLEYALIAEQERPESHITKILLFLEKTLFTVKFYSFVQEQGSLLTIQPYFSREHSEYISKKLTDTVPALHATKIDKTGIPQEMILAHQRILLQNIIAGLMFDFQDKQQSIGVKDIMTELKALKDTIENEQNCYELTQQHNQLHGKTPMPS